MLLALERAGSLPKMRLTGMLVGMKETCPAARELPGHLPRRRRQARRELRGDAPAPARDAIAKRFLIGAINDPSALGALRALQEAGRSESAPSWARTRRPKGAPNCDTRHAADWIGRLLPGEVRRRDRRRRARHPPSPLGAARRVRQAPARHAGDRRPHLSERSPDASHVNRLHLFLLRWGPTPSAAALAPSRVPVVASGMSHVTIC